MFSAADINSLWGQLFESLGGRLKRPHLQTLASMVNPLSVDGESLVIGVPNEFALDWVRQRYGPQIDQALREISPQMTVKYVIHPTTPNVEDSAKIPEDIPKPSVPEANSYLNPRYTFATFVVGHGNRFAHAAALAVAEAPAKAYNPLFIYGGVGLGKTHLMQGIGHHALKINPRAKVIYATAEKYTNDLIGSLQSGDMDGFRNKYRGSDILLVDDIQFLAGKERTKEEFFHTFNTLHESSKQIVLSSDRPPKEIPALEERLRSRFEWGLTADIQPPDLETRIAILRKKAATAQISVPDDIYELIATRITSNIRELEGALIKVFAYSSLTGANISFSVAERVIQDITSPLKEDPRISIEMVKKAAAQYFSVRIDDLSAKIRTKEIATARQVAMYIARELTNSSLPKIGAGFGGRDHSTVIHAYAKIKAGIERDPQVAEAVKNIMQTLRKIS